MRYFLTGATGFLGGAVARQLIEQGHEVVAVVREPSRAAELVSRGVEIHQGDITDRESMRAPMTGVDGVFHMAAWYKIGEPSDGVAERSNVEGTRNVLTLMRDLAIPKGVYTSTVGVFSNTEGNMPDESYVHRGPFLTEYERTKWKAHYEVALPLIREGLPLVIVMPGVIFGPGDTSLVGEQIVQYLKGRLFFAPREATYCWGYIDDTAHAHLLAMDRGTPGETYIIAGEKATFLDVLVIGERITGIPRPRLILGTKTLRGLARVMGVVERVIPLPHTFRAESIRAVAGISYLGSNEKARRELGFAPRPLVDGFRATAEYELARLGKSLPG